MGEHLGSVLVKSQISIPCDGEPWILKFLFRCYYFPQCEWLSIQDIWQVISSSLCVNSTLACTEIYLSKKFIYVPGTRREEGYRYPIFRCSSNLLNHTSPLVILSPQRTYLLSISSKHQSFFYILIQHHILMDLPMRKNTISNPTSPARPVLLDTQSCNKFKSSSRFLLQNHFL